ncbi:SPOSA6832_04071, partial [Sporobolomyces salmonicolor]
MRQAGNQIATAFWEGILGEHGLDYGGHLKDGVTSEQTDRLDVFFSEAGMFSSSSLPGFVGILLSTEAREVLIRSLSCAVAESKKYVPRGLQIDLEPSTGDAIKGSKIGGLFRPSGFIFGNSGAGNNWAKGYYTEGAELVDTIMDQLRHEAEGCELLQGFQLVHSIGGGTGSGLGTLLLGKIREEVGTYPDRMLATYSILPSPKVSETVVEPYNAVLSFHQLVEQSDLTFNFDNEALSPLTPNDILKKTLKKDSPAYPDLNDLIARVMSGISQPLRFPGQLNSDLRKLGTNLVPFPRLHFFTTSYAPLIAPGSIAHQRMKIPEITSQLFEASNQMAASDPRTGKYLTVAAYFRGRNLSSREVEESMLAVHQRNPDFFVEWIPNSAQTALCSVPPADAPVAGTLISNNTCVQDLFRRTHSQFAALFKRHVATLLLDRTVPSLKSSLFSRAFLHWYTGEGMDEMEFTEAESNMSAPPPFSMPPAQYQEAGLDEEEEYLDETGEEGIEYADE